MENNHAGGQGATRPAAAPPKSRRPFLILGGIAVLVLGGLGIHSLLNAGKETTDDAQIEADVVAVAPRVGGQVLHVNVKDNQPVKKGDVLLELDDADYAARVKQSTAELESARAQAEAADAQLNVVTASATGGYSSAKAVVNGSTLQVASSAAQLAAAQAGLQRAQAEQTKAQTDLTRAEALFKANAVPQERLDNARISLESAHAAVAQAEAQVAVAKETRRMAQSRVEEATGRLSQSSPIDAQIASAKANAQLAHARVEAASALLDLAKLQLSYTRVVAPEDGMVSQLTAREGQMVQPSQALGQLVPQASYIVANFKETQIGAMLPGDEAEIVVEAFPGRHFKGKVESLSGGTGSRFSLLPPDNASGNFVKVVQRVPVRIAWEQTPDVPMRAGLSAEVTVTSGSHAPQSVARSQP